MFFPELKYCLVKIPNLGARAVDGVQAHTARGGTRTRKLCCSIAGRANLMHR